jgi:flagellar hook-basal body protein
VNSRFGVKVAFNSGTNTFEFTSGSTGDQSSVRIDTPNARAEEIFTFGANKTIATPVSEEAFRGVPSSSAKLEGSSVQISNINAPIRIDSTNNNFFVFVNGIRANIQIESKEYANVDAVAAELKSKINSVYDLNTGMKISGVDVRFNQETRGFTFETATQGAGSSILVIGDQTLGLDNLTIATADNSSWTQLQQHIEGGRVQFVQNGVAADSVDLANDVEWYPLYLDPGELTFSGGQLLSPNPGMQFEAFKLGAGVKDLDLTIDYSKTRESNAPFTVFAQNQDGRPEGDLLGLDIGDDGTVTATYSNATQDRLGKIVLVSFPTPTGLRQIGDSSFLATQASGNPRIGEPGTSGFGSIRSGAIERSNVDLTQELVDLITSQRNFQANAKAIETNSTMTQSIINIRS